MTSRLAVLLVVLLASAACSDSAPATACQAGSTPAACGPAGSACVKACLPTGAFAECLPTSGPTDYATDAKNCGSCGIVCPTPAHASARCRAAACGRGPCETGYFDLDHDLATGCEAHCVGRTCTLGDGTTVVLDADPLPEAGILRGAFATGSSYGGFVQTNRTHTNIGVLGESTPPPAGEALQKNATHTNIPGLGGTQSSATP
jgi:hypothetical protein